MSESPLARAAHRAAVVDGEVVDHRLHGEGQGVLQAALRRGHQLLEIVLGLALALGIDDEPHAAAGDAAEHEEAPVGRAEAGADLLDERLRVMVRGPGDDRLDGAEEVVRGGAGDFPHVAPRKAASMPTNT